MLDQLVEQMKEKQGVTEKLKAENQMLWVGKMNNIMKWQGKSLTSILQNSLA